MNAPEHATHARLTATLLLAGAALLIVGNALHPIDADPSAVSRLPLATDVLWMPIHLTLAVGFVLVAAALVSYQWSLPPGRARVAARLGAFPAAMGGLLLFAVFGGLDGYAVSSLASDWAAAPDPGALEGAAVALEAIDTGLAGLGTLALLGLALLAIGRSLQLGQRVNRWHGTIAIVLGTAGTVTGVLLTTVGPTPLTINVLMRPLGLASTLFFIALGIALRRSVAREVPVEVNAVDVVRA